MSGIERFTALSRSFDQDTTQVLGSAFDAACAIVGRMVQPVATREAIAKAIVEAASLGERDPIRLRNAGLQAIGDPRR
jgi:hypothetical protein